jgi:hypothetical protein
MGGKSMKVKNPTQSHKVAKECKERLENFRAGSKPGAILSA